MIMKSFVDKKGSFEQKLEKLEKNNNKTMNIIQRTYNIPGNENFRLYTRNLHEHKNSHAWHSAHTHAYHFWPAVV